MINGHVTGMKYNLLELINSLAYPKPPNDFNNCRLIATDRDKEVRCVLGRNEWQNF